MMDKNGKIAFVSFGEINSPKELLHKMVAKAYGELAALGKDIFQVDTVTDDPEGLEVRRALDELQREQFDVLIVCIAGWVPSHAVIAITETYKQVPMLLWGLAGKSDNRHIVTTAAQAGTTALRKVFEDLGYKFCYVYNVIGKETPLERIGHFINASLAVKKMENSRVGMIGYRDMRLYNTLYDGISLKRILGTEIEYVDMLEMVQLASTVRQEDIDTVFNNVVSGWNIAGTLDEPHLKKGITYYLAIKQLAEQHRLDAVSLKDVDGMKKILQYPPAIIFMLLADEMKRCTIPENDTMGAVTQLIVKSLTGQCAAYLEFYEFFEESLLMGVPDYVPAEVVEGPVKLIPAAFGQISGGLLNVSTLKTGQVTLARLSHTGNRYTMHLTVGMAGLISWEEAGWSQPAPQLPSLEVKLNVPVAEFADRISGQHYIIAYGDHSVAIRDFCYLKGITVLG